jgi:hypothetical protein
MDNIFDLAPRLARLVRAFVETLFSTMPCIPLIDSGVSRTLLRPSLDIEIVSVLPQIPRLAKVIVVKDAEVIHVDRDTITVMAPSLPNDPEYESHTVYACLSLDHIMETILTACRVYRILEENRRRCSNEKTIEMLGEMCATSREILSMASSIASGLTGSDIHDYVSRLRRAEVPSTVVIDQDPGYEHDDGAENIFIHINTSLDTICIYSDGGRGRRLITIGIPAAPDGLHVTVHTSMDTAVRVLRRAIDLTMDALRYVIAMKTAVQLWRETAS